MTDKFPPVTFTLGKGKYKKEHTIIPETVPWSDKSYLNESQIGELNKPHWLYCCLKTGEIAVVKYRVDHEDGSKDFYYLSYGKGKWWRKNLFDELANQHGIKKDLYKANYLLEEEGRDPDTVDFVEGEKTCDSARKKFEDLHFTTFGGCGGYKNFDFSILKDKKVLLHHDVDEKNDTGKNKYEELCLYLIDEYEIDAKVVPYPTYEEIQQMLHGAFDKNGWGLEDTIPEELDIYELRKKAYVPERPPVQEVIQHSDIRKALKEFIYVRKTGNSYYEKATRELVDQSELNNLYLRAKAAGDFTERSASDWLQKNNIPVANGLTYYPVDKEFIVRDNKVFINKYVSPVHKDLGNVPGLLERIDWFFKLISFQAENEKYETDLFIKALACSVQYPEENRTWVVLLSSLYHGTGKGLVYDILRYLLGNQNCVPVKLPALANKFNGWQQRGNNVLVDDVNNKKGEDGHTIGALKTLTTAQYHEVELKGKDTVTINCHYNIYISTNDVKPYTVEPNDRRHFYLRNELRPLPDEFYEDILFNKVSRRDGDTTELQHVAHYLKYVYKISREECQKFYGSLPKTKWHYLLLEESLTGYMQELWNVYQGKLIPSFHWELYNIDQIYSELRKFIHNDTRNKDHMLSSLPSKDQIKKFLRSINCVTFRARRVTKNGKVKFISDAIEPTTDKNHKPRGHYWIDPNHVDTWKDNRDISIVNKHFNDPLIYARAHRDPDKHYREERYNPHMHVGDLLEQEEQMKDFPF